MGFCEAVVWCSVELVVIAVIANPIPVVVNIFQKVMLSFTLYIVAPKLCSFFGGFSPTSFSSDLVWDTVP